MEENKQNRKTKPTWYCSWKQASCEQENDVIRPVDRCCLWCLEASWSPPIRLLPSPRHLIRQQAPSLLNSKRVSHLCPLLQFNIVVFIQVQVIASSSLIAAIASSLIFLLQVLVPPRLSFKQDRVILLKCRFDYATIKVLLLLASSSK